MLDTAAAYNDSFDRDRRDPAPGRGRPGFANRGSADGKEAWAPRIPARVLPELSINLLERKQETMAKSPDGTLHKQIRILPAQWALIERAAEGTLHSPNQLLVDLAMDALDHRETLTAEAQIQIARATLFTAQAIARDLIAAGRENEIDEIRDFISTIVPNPDANRVPATATTKPSEP